MGDEKRPIHLWLAVLLAVCWGLVWAGPLRAEESLTQRRARIERMDPVQKEQLLRRQERFASLDPIERERLRALHAQLESDPQSSQLRRVMERYYQWLKTLAPYQRATLLELPPAERVRRIKKLLDEQSRKSVKRPVPREFPQIERVRKLLPELLQNDAKRPSAQDVEGLLSWLEEYAVRHGSQFTEDLPAPRREELRQELSGIQEVKDASRRRETLGLVWLRWQASNPAKTSPITDKELAELRTKLTPATRQRLEALPVAGQWHMVSGWMRVLMLYQYATRRTDPPDPLVNDEELARFFERDLNPEQRDRLLSLPGEEIRWELWRMYLRAKLPEMPARPPDRPARVKRPASTGPQRAHPPKAAQGAQPGAHPAPHAKKRPAAAREKPDPSDD